MISRLVTVDLVLTVSHRLSLEAKDPSLPYYEAAIQILNGWAKRIESEGLAVSLDAISENALLRFSMPDNTSELRDIGNDLIERTKHIELLLTLGRLANQKPLEDWENAAQPVNLVEWFQAAKQITGLKNSTDASHRLQKLCVWTLDFEPKEGSALRKLLDEAVNGECPDIPEQLIGKLKEFHRLFEKPLKKFRHIYLRKPAKSV